MSKLIDLLVRNRTVILSSAVSLAAGFGIGYIVRDKKYVKVEFNENGELISAEDDNIVPVDFLRGDRINKGTHPSSNKGTHPAVKDFEAKITQDNSSKKDEEDSEAKAALEREQEAIRQELIKSGTHFDEYEIKDDGFPTYPKDKPNPRDIVVQFPGGAWSWAEQEKIREKSRIYVLHKDEFYADENGWPQVTLTYFAADDVLVDEDETPIPNYKRVVGELQFGHGVNDENVFHVRNTIMNSEYEVVRDPGSYLEIVLGMDPQEADSE